MPTVPPVAQLLLEARWGRRGHQQLPGLVDPDFAPPPKRCQRRLTASFPQMGGVGVAEAGQGAVP